MATRARSMRFYYDIVSPYSWVGMEMLVRLNAAWRVPLALRPLFLGGVMKAAENKPPATVPAKGAYMAGADLPRLERALHMTIRTPAVFPANTIKVQRALTALAQRDDALLLPASRALWRAYWGGGALDPTDDASIVATLQPVVPYAADLVAASATPAVKKALEE